jgi:FKBP-type peptidyl-prolyl cis-trans isomerase
VITLPSGLQYKILKDGSGRLPQATDEVTVNYVSSSIDGTEFDNSYKRGKAITAKIDKLIPGWKEALLLMKEGSKWQLIIPAQLGYGVRMAGPILPNSVLVCELELISTKPMEAEKSSK